MPVDWWRPQDIDRLAERETLVEFDEPLTRFPRLRPMLRSPEGDSAGTQHARGVIRVFREDGRPTAEVEVGADLPLRCQRCLGPVSLPVSSAARVRLVDSAGDPQSTEEVLSGSDIEDTFLAEHGRIVLPELVEEELLLAMPLIARHDDERDCARWLAAPNVQSASSVELSAPEGEDGNAAEASQLPFAGLSELLKRPR